MTLYDIDTVVSGTPVTLIWGSGISWTVDAWTVFEKPWTTRKEKLRQSKALWYVFDVNVVGAH